ncbi:hypothetical protein BD410DRAFT_841996 [Rickenella mellea]|uniref:Uncharacterized protein n=1 Tax=Rickenella mellea TaxID=50990 RepID=A0A4Y7PW80_9AGAM|nr:hypothetical protein BD410DRAFT_841996 [Rickenella mellea]
MKVKFGKARTSVEKLIKAAKVGIGELQRFINRAYVDYDNFLPKLTYLVPADEVPALLRTTLSSLFQYGFWVRIIRGTYGGDLACLYDWVDREKGVVKVAVVPRPGGRRTPRQLMETVDFSGIFKKDKKEYIRGLLLHVVKIRNLKPTLSPPLHELMLFLESKADKMATKDIASRLLKSDDRVKIIAGDFETL